MLTTYNLKMPHAVYGEEAFKWVLTVVFPDGFEA